MIDPGLCGRCTNARVVETRRGSRFYRCELSRKDPRFPRYPVLPVVRCAGHVPGTPSVRPAGENHPTEEAR